MKRLGMSMSMSMSLLVLLALAGCREQAEPASVSTSPAGASAPSTTTTRPAAKPAKVGEPVALAVTTLAGARFDLADHRGDWVLVNYWATWCGPCLEEMPELSALAAMRLHIRVIGLAYEDIEPAEMRAFLEHHPVTYPIAIIGTDAPPAVFEVPRGLPLTHLVAPDGRLAKSFLGPVDAQMIEDAIAAAGGPKPGKS